MDIIERYEALANRGRWTEALPLIEEIVKRDETCDTSWFNYGVCLEALGRFGEAISAFKRAYDWNHDDKGIQYRIFCSLALNGDVKEFTKFAELEVAETPEVLEIIRTVDEFAEMSQHKWFRFKMKRFA